ncbi:23979_t:CDS:1, partial [Gigaspora margarita]
ILPQTFVARNKKKIARKIFLYHKITEQRWEDFSTYINNCMNSLKLDPNIPIRNQDILNKHWYKWNMVVKKVVNKHIPIIKSAPKPFHTFSFKATKLHQALKLSSKAKKLISSSPLPKSTQAIVDEINVMLQQLDELANYPTSLIAEQDL